jgi:cellulose synthase/poly-beta-1,6-N-acetylglucosamine synthase-like glycosyltransferase
MYYLAALGFFIFVFPFTLYPLSLALARRVMPQPIRKATPVGNPPLSVLFCAHNEENVIDAKARNLMALKQQYRGSCEILAYVDGCTDRTREILEKFGDAIKVLGSDEHRGKSYGMSLLAEAARGRILVFTDANVIISDSALDVAVEYFEDPSIGCVCGNLRLTNPADSVTASIGSAYWRFEEWIKQLESDTGSTLGADGSLFAVRTDLYRRTPSDIIDDMHTSLNVLIQGKRVVRAQDFAAYETVTVRPRDEFGRKVRIACRAFNCFRLLATQLHRTGLWNVYKLYGHKVLRWFGIFFISLAVFPLSAGLAMDKHWVALSVFGGLAILGAVSWIAEIRRLSAPFEIFLAFLATGFGVIQSLCGKRYQRWHIAASSRPGAAPESP